MVDAPRKKSPRAPSMVLSEALDRAMKAYDKDRLHAAPTEIVAQNIGYKNANSGTALSAIASLRYYGLLDRQRDGFLIVTKDVETYRYAPSEDQKQQLLVQFLRTPPLYADLLAKYGSGLPSDATLKFDLIQRGFIPSAADTALSVFKQSVDFVKYFEYSTSKGLTTSELPPTNEPMADEDEDPLASLPSVIVSANVQSQRLKQAESTVEPDDEMDKIPVRLTGGRRAWLLIPTPFFAADKIRLKAQIDLLLAEDEVT